MAYHVCSCFIFLLFQHLYLCLKILFLKPDLFFDLLSCHGHIFRNCHPFVFHIIKAVDDGYHFSCKFFYRMIDPQNVNILFLAVRSDDSFDVAVIYRVKKLFVFRMITVHWAVDHDMYDLPRSLFSYDPYASFIFLFERMPEINRFFALYHISDSTAARSMPRPFIYRSINALNPFTPSASGASVLPSFPLKTSSSRKSARSSPSLLLSK